MPTHIIQQLDDSYRRWTGQGLPCSESFEGSREQWIHDQAPYSLVAHNNDADPHFIYTNACALSCFKYEPEVFCAMPSRFSASSLDRAARQTLLEVVTAKGIASGYTGYRVDRHGQPFMIHDGIVWEVLDAEGVRQGQAALFWPHPAPVGRLQDC
ncbi:MEKHLA domain-containing protein [Pseudomonas fluorescens]|uniref:MEKHLA domain-containing protein n=1 Tax=Pseudomonas fluorescens TaxID=294 RepID=UPI00352699EC